jgi:hypothetical protein
MFCHKNAVSGEKKGVLNKQICEKYSTNPGAAVRQNFAGLFKPGG